MRINRRAAAFTGAVVGAAIVWGTMIERALPVLRNEAIVSLPRGSSPLRILHLSDLHLAPWQNRKIRWIRALAETRPDLIVLTGDLMGHKDALPQLRVALEKFTGVPGVFVHGSNDYYAPVVKNPFKYLREPSRLSTRIPDIDTTALERLLEGELGFKNLNNRVADIEVKDSRLRFFGLGDPHIRYDDATLMRTDLSAADNASTADVRIGVVHAPYLESLDVLLGEGSDIIFAGHTHGGQVRVPGVGALTSNSDLPPSQARGLSVWHNGDSASFLHVSAGLGNSIYAPVRFACRPEASMLLVS